MILSLRLLPFLLLLAAPRAQHGSHVLPPIPLEILERPVPLRAGIGRAHDQAATSSKDAQALYDQGLAYLHSYVWIEAARSFNAALRADSQLALAHVGLTIAYVELSRPAEARKAIDAARALMPRLPEHDRQHIEARTVQMAAEDAPRDTTKLVAYRKVLDEAMARFPKDIEFVLLRGMAESDNPADRGQGGTSASAKYYERALTMSPDHFAAHHYLTHAYENAGRVEESLTHGATFARLSPQVPHARHMHGHSLRRVGRHRDAIAEFEAADRLHREYFAQDRIPREYDWHFEHNVGLLAASLQHAGQMKRAETLLKAAFALPTNLLVQAYNKREWPMFLRARGRHSEAATAAEQLTAHANPVVQAIGHIELGFARLAENRWGDAAAASNVALQLLRTAPGGVIAANALQALQGEFNLRTAAQAKGRATLEEVARKVRAAPGQDAWSQALFTLDDIARAARDVGDWEFARLMAQQIVEHDAMYAGGHYALGLAAEHAGDMAAARQEFELARKYWSSADPAFPELLDAQKKLR